MAFHTSHRHAKADYTFMMHVPESGCWFYVFEQLSLPKSIPKRASDWTNTATPLPSYPLQPSSHLLSNVLVFISRLNKCLFLQHARTLTHRHTPWFLSPNELVQTLQHFLPKAAPSILVARVIEVSVLVQQPNTLETQDAGNICLHCATYRQLVCQLRVQAVWKRNRCWWDSISHFKHSCIKAIYSSRSDCHLVRNWPIKSSVHSAPSRRPRALLTEYLTCIHALRFLTDFYPPQIFN
jgi:hypothetical protein